MSVELCDWTQCDLCFLLTPPSRDDVDFLHAEVYHQAPNQADIVSCRERRTIQYCPKNGPEPRLCSFVDDQGRVFPTRDTISGDHAVYCISFVFSDNVRCDHWLISDGNTLYPREVVWSLDDEPHLEGEPAAKAFSSNGQCLKEEWYNHGLLIQSEQHPSVIEYHQNGYIKAKMWGSECGFRGRLNRCTGPAIVRYNDSGAVTEKSYYLDGEKFSLGTWAERVFSSTK